MCGWEEPLCRGTSFSRGRPRHGRSSAAVIARNDAELRRGPPAHEGPPPPSRGCRGPPPVAPPLGLRPPADRPAAAAAPAEPTDVDAKYRTFLVMEKRGRGWGFVCGWEEPLCRGTSFSRGGSRHRRSLAPIIARNDAELRRGPPVREGPPPPSRGCRGPSPVRVLCRLRLCRLRRPEPTDVGAKCLTFPAVGIAGRGGPPKLAKPHTSLAAGEPSARREAQNPEA